MSATDDLTLLLERLRTDTALQAGFRADPVAATERFELTGHERDAVVTHDCDDLVALGVVSSITQLPDVLECPRRSPLALLLERLRERLRRRRGLPPRIDPDPGPWPIPDLLPEPPRPRPRPEPRPGPGPRPGPRPGPDPPGPDG
jgi:hypothetical protein